MRRSLQAFLPSDDRLGTLHASCSNLDVFRVSLSPNGKGRKKEKEKRGYSAGRRRKVDHWVPAIWIPDGKNEFLYEMWLEFWVALTTHHCRLCGRCICASCSGRVSSINFTFPSWSNFGTDHILLQTFSFRILMPNKIHHRRRLNLHELVMLLWYRVSGHSSSSNRRISTDIDNESDDMIPSLLHFPSRLSMPLRANPMHWWQSTRHYMYTFIEKWIIIVYYEHIIIYASSWTDGAEVVSDVYLYSRWLWWTLDSSIYKTSIPEGCRTRTISRMQE